MKEVFERSICKECIKIKSKKYRNENKDKISKIGKNYYKNNKETILNNNSNYYENNKDKILKTQNNYKEKNKEKIKINRDNNKEIKKEYDKNYFSINKLFIYKQANKRRKEKLNSDPSFKLRKSVSSSILNFLKNNNISKDKKSILLYLPYTMDQLKEHIEKQFKLPENKWMSWENWTSYNPKMWNDNDKSTWVWNLDHVIPHSEFKYDSMEHPDFKKCWALENLRPCSAKMNIIDGGTKIRHKNKK